MTPAADETGTLITGLGMVGHLLRREGVHGAGELPSEIKEYHVSSPAWIVKALISCKLAVSSSDARRLIKSNAVSIDQNKILDEQLQLSSGEYTLQVGKKKFAKLKVD